MTIKLGKRQTGLLLEATRRWLMSDEVNHDEGITGAWTGLGSATTYKPVFDAGFMTYATRKNPGYSTWWKLTDKGAKIVQKWIDDGIGIESFTTGWNGNYALIQQSSVCISSEGQKIVRES